jgi:regulator of replication initiation timing
LNLNIFIAIKITMDSVETLAKQIEELRNFCETLGAQNQELGARNQELAAKLQEREAEKGIKESEKILIEMLRGKERSEAKLLEVLNRTSNSKGRKEYPAPPVFDGRGRGACNGWMRQAKLHLKGYMDISTETQVDILGAYLTGHPKSWHDELVESGRSESYVDIEEYFKEFVERFADRITPSEALSQLRKLREGSGYDSYDRYVHAFNHYAPFTNLPEGDLFTYFRQGLRTQEARLNFFNIDMSKSLGAAQLEMRNRLAKFGVMEDRGQRIAETTDSTTPMDLDHIRVRNQQRRPFQPRQYERLDPSEWERCVREGRCFRCKQVGHTSIRCRSKTQLNEITDRGMDSEAAEKNPDQGN